MDPDIDQPFVARSLWTGPREAPRRYRVDLVDGALVNIGDGGEGLVFRATANFEGSERVVALKMHTSLTLEDFERFTFRARSLSQIDHPNVMHLIEVFIGTSFVDRHDSLDEDFNVMYSVADWIPGLSMAAALETANAASGLRWVCQIARATAYLHDFRSGDALEGVIHRDIKPSNVRVTPDDHAVLIDFGIARPHAKGDLTEGAGTYLWRAPEVVGGPGEPGPASDVWGIGALAHWVLLGEPPRLESAETARPLLTAAARKAGLPDPRHIARDICELLATHPKGRPTDLGRWANRLESTVDGRNLRRLQPALVLCVALGLLSALVVLGMTLVGSSPPHPTSYAFPPEAFSSGMIANSTWTVPNGGDTLQDHTVLTNGAQTTLHTQFDVVIPAEVAANIGNVRFSPLPDEVLERDPVAGYRLVDLAPRHSYQLWYSVTIPGLSSGTSAKLEELANDQEKSQLAYLDSTGQTQPATLTSLELSPGSLQIQVGQNGRLTPSGQLGTGSPASASEIRDITWKSQNPAIATCRGGIVEGISSGSTVVTAREGHLTASATVSVVVPNTPTTASSGQSGSSPGSSRTSGGADVSPSPTTTAATSAPQNPSSVATTSTSTSTTTTTTMASTPPAQQPTETPSTYSETTGGTANTWSDYNDASGTEGPTIGSNQTVQIACKVTGFKVEDGNTWWYRIASSPWNNVYYVSADAFYNDGSTSGSLIGTPFVDPAVPTC